MDTCVSPGLEYPPPKPGEPPLHRAARLGDGDAIRRLIAGGADLNGLFDVCLCPDARPHPATALMVAAGSGDGASADTVSLLLELGADPKLTVGDESAATFACAGLGWNYAPGGDGARLRILLEAGSPLPASTDAANRLLCDTAGSGDAARLRLLLSHGLDARGCFDPERARRSSLAMMKRMADYRSDQSDPLASLPAELRASMAESMRETEAQMAEQSASAPWSFEIPLFRAAESDNAECVQLLLEAGADPKARDNSKQTAMYRASSVPVIRELMSAGLRLEDEDALGWTPLLDAISEGGLTRVKALIDVGADVNATRDHGYTIFMSAVGSGRVPDMLRLLVAYGADPHALSEMGYNAFHAAIDVNGEANVEESVRDTLSYLRELGVNIEQRNKAGQTPLACALQYGSGIEVQVLCELGANPNAVCPKHKCGGEECIRIDLPLLFHAADGIGREKDVKTEALLRAGADPLVKDPEGCTPLARAVAALCSDAADYIVAFEAFLEGRREIRLDREPMPSSREAFMAAAIPAIRAYTERFAAGLPFAEDDQYAAQWRAEGVMCITKLCAYEAWAVRERVLGTNL